MQLAVVESFTGPQREVVSIYNDDFTTSSSRPQYFIEVYRCVKVDVGECPASRGPSVYPVPDKIEEIEIVVPDITNNDRDSSDEKKFYKYVVYNHTSCKCGTAKDRKSKLYKTITDDEVPEVYFNAKYTKNPVNLMRVCDVCNSTQPRYSLAPEHENAVPQCKYLAYQQCLPGCVVVKHSRSEVVITYTYAGKFLNVTNDISCKAYDGENAEGQQPSSPTTQDKLSNTENLQGSSEDANPHDKGIMHEYIRVEEY
ncbi:Hypothetical predicted protein [Paramuricea clavata]|uniref:Uncharacterized protein n=1 Tax=Paramuricea clavata TaxID=317549 RepID=A0A6S7JR23_PARCT|nr:Hypothetical predicted protein [Paramuricea clavata]